MKTIKILAAVLFISVSTLVSAQKSTSKKVDVSKSELTWVGHKIGGSHNGTIQLKSGTLHFEKGNLVKGEFKVDMTSISTTDLSGKGKERLDGHLKNEDFFDVEKHPEAMLVFTKVVEKSKTNYEITADLVIKGITQEVKFNMDVQSNQAIANFEIDRTKFDIKYRSGTIFPELADKAIKDNFELAVKLVF